MKSHVKVFLVLGFAVASTWAKCWWTGCQPITWGVRGCDHYEPPQHQRESRGCRDAQGVQGDEYHCCPKGSPDGGGTGAFFTYNQFREAVTSNGFPAPGQDKYNSFNAYARTLGKIANLQEAAMALAQMIHESEGLQAKRELRCVQTQCFNEYRDARCDRPGTYYFGRGYIQLTWCFNYGPASQDLLGDDRLLNNPDLVAKDEKLAWQTAFWFWNNRVRNRDGVQQGKFGASTNAINGGKECSAPGNVQAQARFRIYGNVRRAFGLQGAGDSSGCA
ncbi:unnamed protein product [Orchesella dallaii]|uniref:Glycoside hydrolase family 19 catalytic domain-containing protein n=1 Tax=Orchesella dallaii TaxID=48710 RepID=A0ABP1RIC1_9HEXA